MRGFLCDLEGHIVAMNGRSSSGMSSPSVDEQLELSVEVRVVRPRRFGLTQRDNAIATASPPSSYQAT